MVSRGGVLISNRSLPHRQPPAQGSFQSPIVTFLFLPAACGASRFAALCPMNCHGPAALAMLHSICAEPAFFAVAKSFFLSSGVRGLSGEGDHALSWDDRQYSAGNGLCG